MRFFSYLTSNSYEPNDYVFFFFFFLNVDTNVGLITRKDEASFWFLKAFNGYLEDSFYDLAEKHNVAANVTIPTHLQVSLAPPDDSRGITQIAEKPLYWNGVLRSKMELDDCSAFAGAPSSKEYPLAQQVESRTYWSGAPYQYCASNSSKNQSVSKILDETEGCCHYNVFFDDSDTKQINDCKIGSKWTARWLNDLKVEKSEVERLRAQFPDDFYEIEKEVEYR